MGRRPPRRATEFHEYVASSFLSETDSVLNSTSTYARPLESFMFGRLWDGSRRRSTRRSFARAHASALRDCAHGRINPEQDKGEDAAAKRDVGDDAEELPFSKNEASHASTPPHHEGAVPSAERSQYISPQDRQYSALTGP